MHTILLSAPIYIIEYDIYIFLYIQNPTINVQFTFPLSLDKNVFLCTIKVTVI